MAATRAAEQGASRNALMAMEPELEHVRGLAAALTAMGDAVDAIDPAAIAAMARCMNETIEAMRASLRDGLK